MARYLKSTGREDVVNDEHPRASRECIDVHLQGVGPVFQFVLWGGKSPGEAIAAALIDTHGEA